MRKPSKWDLVAGLGWLGFAVLGGYAYAVGDYEPSEPQRLYALFSAGLGMAFVLRYGSERFRRYEPYVYGGVAAGLGLVGSYFAISGADSTITDLVGATALASGLVALYEFHRRRPLWRTRYFAPVVALIGVGFVSFGVYLRARFPGPGVAALALTSAVVGIVALAWALRTILAH